LSNLNHEVKLPAWHCILTLLIILSVNALSCNSSDKTISTDGPDKPTASGDCPQTKQLVLKPPDVKQLNIFMEVSGSMKGFMPASKNTTTDFQALVPDFISRLKRDVTSTNFYTLAQKTGPIKQIDISTARQNIAFGNFSFGATSTLPVMFDSALFNLKANDVSILITDAIYTPPKTKIKLREQIISDISEIIVKAAKKNYTTSCFMLRSQFSNIVSPYYLFVFGNAQNIVFIKDKLQRSLQAESGQLRYPALHEIHFGFPELTPYFSIIPYVDNTGAGEPAECTENNRYLAMKNIDIKKQPEFWVGFDLSAFPAFAQERNYLLSNLLVSGEGLTTKKISQVLTREEFTPKTEDATDKTLSAKCTHFVRIIITEMQEKAGEIKLSLRTAIPGWIDDYKHDSSDSAETKRDKTFSLDNIRAGMQDAYQDKQSAYFFRDLKIIVTKN